MVGLTQEVQPNSTAAVPAVGVSPQTRSSVSVTRPDNANAYIAGQVLGNAVGVGALNRVFANCGRIAAGTGWIIGATAQSSVNKATKPQLRLHLYSVNPAAMEDAAAFDPSDAEGANWVGDIDFLTFVAHNAGADAAGNAACMSSLDDPIEFTCAAGQTSLWGVWEVLNAYTPVALEVITGTLHILQG